MNRTVKTTNQPAGSTVRKTTAVLQSLRLLRSSRNESVRERGSAEGEAEDNVESAVESMRADCGSDKVWMLVCSCTQAECCVF